MNEKAKLISEEKPLPVFREDLRLYPGPQEVDGSPTYSLFDPVVGQYYRITWPEYLIIIRLRPGLNLNQLIQEIEQNSTLKVSKEEITKFFEDALGHHLLKIPYSSEGIKAKADQLKQGVFKWLIYHYLYIRIPLLNPDKFLGRTLKYVMPFVSLPAFFLYTTLFLMGTFQLITRFDEFLHTFSYFFTVPGLFTYAAGITSVKIIHEFSHAYTAKYYKLFVPTMGIALIVFWPVLYTDVTDSWKLSKRSQRLAISVAGIVAELTIAGLATFFWAFTSPGMLQSIFFVIASITWISTLVVNLNPALRFDGYYLLSDLWGIDNLQARAFATTRWQLRKWLLGLNVEPPESNLSTKRKIGMMVYSIYTWIYRLFLYTAIAIFVYYQFTKALGVFLFILEIVIFILWPLTWELDQLYKLRSFMHLNRRSITTVSVLLLVIAWLVFPYPHLEYFPSTVIASPDASQVVYVPYESTIKAIYVKKGDHVKAGQPLIELSSPQLEVEITKNEIEKWIADREILASNQLSELFTQMGEKKANVQALAEKIAGLTKLKTQLNIVAEVSGTIYQWDETLKEGLTLSQNQVLGRIADMGSLKVIAFIPEQKVEDVYESQLAIFRRKSDLEKYSGTIAKINPYRVTRLIYPQLASINHGALAVAEVTNKEEPLRLIDSYFTALITLDSETESKLNIGETGETEVRGPWRSLFMRFWRNLQSILWRESAI